jgi:hypothetical protein
MAVTFNPTIYNYNAGMANSMGALGRGIGDYWQESRDEERSNRARSQEFQYQTALQEQRQKGASAQQTASFAQQAALQDDAQASQTDRMKFAWQREDGKEAVSKRDQEQEAQGQWEGIKSTSKGLITPEMDEKFAAASLPQKSGMLLSMQAAYRKKLAEEEQGQLESVPIMGPDGKPTGTQIRDNKSGKIWGWQPAQQAPLDPPPGLEVDSWNPKTGPTYRKKKPRTAEDSPSGPPDYESQIKWAE